MASMDTLQKKYGNFMTPDFRIKVDGVDAAKSLNLRLDNVKVKLSMDAAGSLSFDILNAYDLEGRCFKSNIKKVFLPGSRITAEMGYAGNLESVFKGYIHTVNYEYTDVPMLTVTGLDVIRLMQENEGLPRSYQDMNGTDVFKEIMKKYAGLCPASDIKADASQAAKQPIITQKENDYQFIRNTLCAMECRDFYVLDGKAYFVDTNAKKTEILSMEWGKDLLSFSYEKNYLHKKLMVLSSDKDNEVKKIMYSTAVTGKKQKTVLSSPVIKNISMDSKGTMQDARIQAGKAAAEEKKQSLRCTGTCIGIPELVPGKSLTLKKLDGDLDGTYEILTVEQSAGSDGFVTQFELGGKL